MKKIAGVNEPLKNFSGNEIVDTEGPVTIKGMFVHYLGTFKSSKGKDMIGAMKLGQKIFDIPDDEEDVLLENAEFTLLKQATQEPQHIALIYGPMFEAIEGAEDLDKKDKKEGKVKPIKPVK